MSFKPVIAILSFFILAACSHGHKKGHSHHHKGNKGHHKKMWKKMDADGDGSVTRKEFDTIHAEMFTKMDTNNDGKITKEEKMAHLKDKMGKKGEGCCSGE